MKSSLTDAGLVWLDAFLCPDRNYSLFSRTYLVSKTRKLVTPNQTNMNQTRTNLIKDSVSEGGEGGAQVGAVL